MSDGPRQCALAGCTALILSPKGEPQRYCSTAHRTTARKHRRATVRAVATSAALVIPDQAPDPAGNDPAGNDPAVPEQVAPALPTGPVTGSAHERYPLVLAAAICARGVPAVAAPPPRPADQRDVPRTWQRGAVVRHRRRTVALIVVASLMAGGTDYVLTDAPAQTVPAPEMAPPSSAPISDAEQWAQQAAVVLTSLDRQLTAIAQTEQSWNQRAGHRWSATPPPAVRALLDRKMLLLSQRTWLQSQLSAWRSLPQLGSDLAAAQAELDALDRALHTPAPGTAPLQHLAEQRAVLVQQRDHNARALEILRAGARQALATPLPVEFDSTTPVIDEVLALINSQPEPYPVRVVDFSRQVLTVLPHRRAGSSERQEVTVSAPLDPPWPTVSTSSQQRNTERQHDPVRAVRHQGEPPIADLPTVTPSAHRTAEERPTPAPRPAPARKRTPGQALSPTAPIRDVPSTDAAIDRDARDRFDSPRPVGKRDRARRPTATPSVPPLADQPGRRPIGQERGRRASHQHTSDAPATGFARSRSGTHDKGRSGVHADAGNTRARPRPPGSTAREARADRTR